MGFSLASTGSVKTPTCHTIASENRTRHTRAINPYLARFHVLEIHSYFSSDTISEPQIRSCNLCASKVSERQVKGNMHAHFEGIFLLNVFHGCSELPNLVDCGKLMANMARTR